MSVSSKKVLVNSEHKRKSLECRKLENKSGFFLYQIYFSSQLVSVITVNQGNMKET